MGYYVRLSPQGINVNNRGWSVAEPVAGKQPISLSTPKRVELLYGVPGGRIILLPRAAPTACTGLFTFNPSDS